MILLESKITDIEKFIKNNFVSAINYVNSQVVDGNTLPIPYYNFSNEHDQTKDNEFLGHISIESNQLQNSMNYIDLKLEIFISCTSPPGLKTKPVKIRLLRFQDALRYFFETYYNFSGLIFNCEIESIEPLYDMAENWGYVDCKAKIMIRQGS